MNGYWREFIGWFTAALASLIGIVWYDNVRRIHVLERKIEQKADKADLERQRISMSSLCDRIDDLRKEIHAMHIAILEKIK